MNFYAFIPREDGTAPLGTGNQTIIRDFKLQRNAIKTAIRRLGTSEIVVYSYTNFYDNSTFKLIWNGTKHKQIKLS